MRPPRREGAWVTVPRRERPAVKVDLGAMMTSGTPMMDYIPVVIHRLNRCAEPDRQALDKFFAVVEDLVAEPESFAEALTFHVALSEIWDEQAPSVDELIMRAKIS